MCVCLLICLYVFSCPKCPIWKKKKQYLELGDSPSLWTITIFQDPSSQGQATPWRGRPSSPGSDLASFAVDGHCTKITTLLHHFTSHYTHVALHYIPLHRTTIYIILFIQYSAVSIYSIYIYIIYIYIKHHIPSLEPTGSISPFWGSTNKSSVDVSFRSTAAETSDKSQADAPWTMTWPPSCWDRIGIWC